MSLLKVSNLGKIRAEFIKNPAQSITFLVNDNAEGLDEAASNVDFYSAEVDWDYTSIILDGTESIYIPATKTVRYSFPEKDELWGKMMFRVVTNDAVANIFILYNDSYQIAGNTYFWFDNLRSVHGTATAVSTVDTYAEDTNYYLWWHWKKSTGSDGIMELWFNTTDSKPANGSNKHALVSNGDSAYACSKFQVAQGLEMIIDNIQIAEEYFE